MEKNEIIIRYLDKMLDFEERGYLNEALELNGRLIDLFKQEPEELEQILLERGKLEFRAQLDKEALLDLIRAYEIRQNGEIYDLIVEAYLTPNREILREQYQKNIEALKTYPHYRAKNTPKEWAIFPIWQDEKCLVYTDMITKKFEIIGNKKMNRVSIEPDTVLLVVNKMWIDQIMDLKEAGKPEMHLLDMDTPLILIWDENYWTLFCQLWDLEKLLEWNRCAFLVDELGCRTWFGGEQILFPGYIWSEGNQKYQTILMGIVEKQRKEIEEYKEEIQRYYEKEKEGIRRRIREGRPRILFYACRFTTAVQYRDKNVMKAARRIGCETEMLIEKSGIHRITSIDRIRAVAVFKPDMVFCTNYFRENLGKELALRDIVWVTWLQDKLPQSTGNEEIVKNLGKRDIVVSTLFSDLQGRHWNMHYKEVLKLPLSVDQLIYKRYELTKEEEEYYGCDICFVANASDYRKMVEKDTLCFPEAERKDWQAVIDVYFQLMEDGMIFYGYKNNLGALKTILEELHINWPFQTIVRIAERLTIMLSYSRHKSLIVEWLLDAGYTNIKLYGNDWGNNERFRPYAMGPIENGEKMSKALQAAKIALGTHLSLSLPGRASEIIASGAFCLVNDIPEADIGNAREYFKEGKELVYFYNKEDFLEKVKYYLSHEDERKEIAEAGRQKFIREFTYECLIEKMFAEIDWLLEERKAW